MNQKNFFSWDKSLIKNKEWALLPKASKSIFPVIAIHCNAKGECYPTQQTIADLSGRIEKTVWAGINGLAENEFSGIKISKIKMKGMQWPGNFYYFKFPSTNYFPFYKSLIICGKWHQLKSTAQALYPVMRCLGDDLSFDENYDYCSEKKKVLADYAGISRTSIQAALKSLEGAKLIKPVEDGFAWKVLCRLN